MVAFRGFLVLLWLLIAGYTAVVAASHGMNLLQVFFSDMAAFGWPGQFNLDFMCMLMLSGLWVAWRHHFSLPGCLLGLFAAVGGALFLTAYLLVESVRTGGDASKLLLGYTRAA